MIMTEIAGLRSLQAPFQVRIDSNSRKRAFEDGRDENFSHYKSRQLDRRVSDSIQWAPTICRRRSGLAKNVVSKMKKNSFVLDIWLFPDLYETFLQISTRYDDDHWLTPHSSVFSLRYLSKIWSNHFEKLFRSIEQERISTLSRLTYIYMLMWSLQSSMEGN